MAYTPGPGGSRSTLNVTTTTVIKNAPGRIYKVTIITAPSAAGGIYDSATPTGLGASNLIDNIGTGLANSFIFALDGWPCANGITINPGTAGVVAVSWD